MGCPAQTMTDANIMYHSLSDRTVAKPLDLLMLCAQQHGSAITVLFCHPMQCKTVPQNDKYHGKFFPSNMTDTINKTDIHPVHPRIHSYAAGKLASSHHDMFHHPLSAGNIGWNGWNEWFSWEMVIIAPCHGSVSHGVLWYGQHRPTICYILVIV